MHMTKRLLAAMAVVLLWAASAQAEKISIPDIFRFQQHTMPRENVRKDVYIQRTYPLTTHARVNEEMRLVVDQLAEEGRLHLPAGPITRDQSYLRVGASISRTGQSWMSFLTVANIKHGYEQTYAAFDARVYDLATGTQLTLGDVFAPDSQAWDILAQAVREQLNAYFPQQACDAAALDTLCTREALEQTPFTLTAGSLRLHFRADALYPGRNTLMHVRLLYSSLRPYMTQQAQQQTDNSCYKLIALTFDDGPAHLSSIRVVDMLRQYGADATFFLVGNMMRMGHYVMAYEHDAGFPLAYHSYDHVTDNDRNTSARVPGEWEKFTREMHDITGTTPTVMRAPGGDEGPYIKAQIGLPLIHWSVSSGDGTADRSYDAENRAKIASNVGGGAQDGAVVLMHDLRTACYQYLEPILQRLEERGFLCVTVEELFDAYGVALLPNTTYHGAESAAK